MDSSIPKNEYTSWIYYKEEEEESDNHIIEWRKIISPPQDHQEATKLPRSAVHKCNT